MTTREELQHIYECIYESKMQYKMHVEVRSVLTFLRSKGMESVCDIGTGHGDLPACLAGQGIKAFGYDFALQQPRQDERLILDRAWAHAIPLANQSVDAVTSFDMMEHLLEDDIVPVFQEMKRLAAKMVLVSICYRAARHHWEGRNLHETVRPEAWWVEKMAGVFGIAPAVQMVGGLRCLMIRTDTKEAKLAAVNKKKLIVQVSRTNCAGAIWHLHWAINQFSEYQCRTVTSQTSSAGRHYPSDVRMGDLKAVRDLVNSADVVHFHNRIDHYSSEVKCCNYKGKQVVLQYHSDPPSLQPGFSRNVVTRDDVKTLVIAQKHARFYPNSIPVPNLLNIDDPMLTPVGWERAPGPLRVIFTPTDTRDYPDQHLTCCGKGYLKTKATLDKLAAEGVIEASIIMEKDWKALMPIKRRHDVCIDECVTGGYHLCSLEALSQGLVAIANLDPLTEDIIEKVVGGRTALPWVRSSMDDLEQTLRLLASNVDGLQAAKEASRAWMESYWHPRKMLRHYMAAYGLPYEA